MQTSALRIDWRTSKPSTCFPHRLQCSRLSHRRLAGKGASTAPSATPEPTATPGPAVVGAITSAEELAGVWHRTTRTGMGMDVYRQYTKDGIYRMGTSPEELETRPRVEGRFWFEGDKIVVGRLDQPQLVEPKVWKVSNKQLTSLRASLQAHQLFHERIQKQCRLLASVL